MKQNTSNSQNVSSYNNPNQEFNHKTTEPQIPTPIKSHQTQIKQ